MAALSALQCFGFPLIPAAKAIGLRELAGRFRPRLLHDPQNMAFAKNQSCIHTLDMVMLIFFVDVSHNISKKYEILNRKGKKKQKPYFFERDWRHCPLMLLVTVVQVSFMKFDASDLFVNL